MEMIYTQIAKDGTIKIPRDGKADGIDGIKRQPGGRFQVKFTPGIFAKAPSVIATTIAAKRGCDRTGTSRFMSVTNLTASEVCLATFKASESGTGNIARDFNLLVVGD